MKKTIFAIVVSALTLLSGCTQYNGHIGPIFGSWALTGMTEDGQPLPLDGETVFSFQNEVVQVVRLQEPSIPKATRYGNFTITEDKLILRFQAHPTESGNYLYITPDWLHFPQDGEPMVFEIVKLNGGKMVLTLDTDGVRLDYTFTKTW